MKDRWQLSRIVVAASSVVIAACSQSSSTSTSSLHTPSSSPTAITSASSTPRPSGSPLPSGTFATAKEAGIAAAVAHTGYPYSDGPTPGTNPYLSNAVLEMEEQGVANPPPGVNAALLQFAIINGPVGKCFVYVYNDAPGWRSVPRVACTGPDEGSFPWQGGQVPVVVPAATCANVRQGPGLSYKVVSCLKAGTVVTIDVLRPHYADGRIWWSVNNQQGWMAHDFLISP
jgi:uncharacterized protein YgiM (DUF1202 family)